MDLVFLKEILILNSFSFEDKDPRFTRLKPGLALSLLIKGLFYIRAMTAPCTKWGQNTLKQLWMRQDFWFWSDPQEIGWKFAESFATWLNSVSPTKFHHTFLLWKIWEQLTALLIKRKKSNDPNPLSIWTGFYKFSSLKLSVWWTGFFSLVWTGFL